MNLDSFLAILFISLFCFCGVEWWWEMPSACKFCRRPIQWRRLLLHIEVEHPDQFKRVSRELKMIREDAQEKEASLHSTEKL